MGTSQVAALAAVWFLAAVSHTQATYSKALGDLNVTAIQAVLPETTDKTTGVLLPNPSSPTCEVGIDLKIVNSTVALADAKQPTASPVPSVVQGYLSLQLASIVDDVPTGTYTVTIEVPYGTVMTNVTGGTAGTPTTGNNNTLAVDITVTQRLLPNAGNSVYLNMSVLAASQDFSPRVVQLEGSACAIGLAVNISAPVPQLPDMKDGANLTNFVQTGYVSISGNRIIGVDGDPITLNGANWFGFETGANMVDGLYAGDSTLTADLATVAYRIQLLGFNAIRMPFSFLVLFQSTATNYTRTCAISTEEEIRDNVIDPRDAPNIPADAEPPAIVAPPSTYGVSGVCNDYVPNNSVYTRFLYVVGYFVRQGFYVLIDNHSNTDPTVVNNPATWLAQWTQLMMDITSDPVSKAMVMVDILNEPDSRGLTWANMTTNYINVMNAVYQFSPNTLFFIEGMDQNPIQMCWGDGFVTDAGLIAQYGLSDPRPFFDMLLTMPYLDNVVISPHYYGPSVSQQTFNYTGAGLAYRASTSWGYFTAAGYGGHVFPVVIGETGSQFILQGDLDFYGDFALYLNAESYENDGLHNVVRDLFWWSWNSNSGDTGGLVDTTWVNVIWNKTEYLETTIGLTPWSLLAAEGTTSPSSPSPPPPAASSRPPAASPPLPVPAAAPSPPPPVPTESPPPPTTSPPPPTPSPPPPPVPVAPSPPPPPPGASPPPPVPTATSTPPATSPPTPPAQLPPGASGTCAYAYSIDATWQNGGVNYAVVNLYLQSTTDAGLSTPYPITFSNPDYTGLSSTWNWEASFVAGGLVQGESDPDASWETLQPSSGNTVNLGGIVSTAGSTAPTSVTVNGAACSLSASG